MNQKGKKINGNLDIDTPQMKAMRQTVAEQELSARSWKAYYEKMYYSLEAERLEGPYKEYQERARVRLEEEKEAIEKFRATLQEEIEKQNAETEGELNIEENN